MTGCFRCQYQGCYDCDEFLQGMMSHLPLSKPVDLSRKEAWKPFKKKNRSVKK